MKLAKSLKVPTFANHLDFSMIPRNCQKLVTLQCWVILFELRSYTLDQGLEVKSFSFQGHFLNKGLTSISITLMGYLPIKNVVTHTKYNAMCKCITYKVEYYGFCQIIIPFSGHASLITIYRERAKWLQHQMYVDHYYRACCLLWREKCGLMVVFITRIDFHCPKTGIIVQQFTFE